MTKNQGFTLIELLIAIALIAILEAVVILVFNPAELLKKTRDSTRLADLQILNQLLTYAQLDNLHMASSSVVYVSLPSDYPDCSDLNLPRPLPDDWSYVCKSQADYRKTNGDGWVPVNFSQLSTIKAQLAVLPIDPINSAANGLYYTYTIGGPADSPWELTDPLESKSYQIKYAATDNGISTTVYETGKNIKITPVEVAERGPETGESPLPPTVTTAIASNIAVSSATLNGSANPNSAATTGWFRYDTVNPGSCNNTFGTRAPSSGGSSLDSGNVVIDYFQNITNLLANTTYYFCAIAQNSFGVSFGSILSFTTLDNRLFVAVAGTGTNQVMTSANGINWTASAAAVSGWVSVTYGNGLFVAVADSGTNRVMTSPDGVNWTPRSAAEANTWYSVTYGNGLFVAVADSGTNRVMTSANGIDWTPRSAAEANPWYSVTYGNGLFVAVAGSGTNRVMTSPDGVNWTPRSAAEASGWYSVTYGNDLFVAVAYTGTGNRVMTSANGIDWTPRSAAAVSGWVSVTYGNDLFVAVAYTGTNRVMTSPDGVNWTPRSAAEANTWYSVTYGNGLFVAVAFTGTNRVMTSPDGVNWTPRSAAEANSWYSVTSSF